MPKIYTLIKNGISLKDKKGNVIKGSEDYVNSQFHKKKNKLMNKYHNKLISCESDSLVITITENRSIRLEIKESEGLN